MSLLDDLHKRVDELSPEQQRSLKLWLDYQLRKAQHQESDDLTEFARAASSHLARTWPNDDWSQEYEAWKKAREKTDAAG